MNEKQTLFVKYYIISKNATDAYKKAYGDHLSNSACAAAGERLLRNVKVKEKIDEELNKLTKRIDIDQDYVINGLVEIHQLGIQSGNLAASNKALESLAKILGLFKDKIEVNADVNNRDEHSLSVRDIDRRIREIIRKGKDSDSQASLPD